jgi:hypothetical protein
VPTVSIEDLKKKFKAGSIPSSEDFVNLVETCYNYSLSNYYLSGYSLSGNQ